MFYVPAVDASTRSLVDFVAIERILLKFLNEDSVSASSAYDQETLFERKTMKTMYKEAWDHAYTRIIAKC